MGKHITKADEATNKQGNPGLSGLYEAHDCLCEVQNWFDVSQNKDRIG